MTIVSHSHQFVFLKTHKTASTSVEMLFEPLCRPPGSTVKSKTDEAHTKYGIVGRRDGGRAVPLRLFNWRDHMSARKCRRALGRKKWSAYTKITTVRDPYDRILSQFFWWNNDKDFETADAAQVIAAFRDFLTNTDWGDDTEIVTLNGKFIPDHTIRYENLADDIRSVSEILSLPINVDQLPQSNTSSNRKRNIPIEDFFDQPSINLIQKRLAWIFDNFEYGSRPQSSSDITEVTQ